LGEIINRRGAGVYIPSFKVAEMVGISGRGLLRITSSFLVVTLDNFKIHLGLNMKFEAKVLKVIDYSRKDRQYWLARRP
jgi:5'-3' exoribonuclease 1